MKKVSHCLREKIRPTKKKQRQEHHHLRKKKKKVIQGTTTASTVPDCVSSFSKVDATAPSDAAAATTTLETDTEVTAPTSTSCCLSPVTVLDPQFPLLYILTPSTFPTFTQVLFPSSSMPCENISSSSSFSFSSSTKHPFYCSLQPTPATTTNNNNNTTCESVLDVESAQLLLEILS